MLGIKQYGSKIRPHVSWGLISVHIVCESNLRSISLLKLKKNTFILLHNFGGHYIKIILLPIDNRPMLFDVCHLILHCLIFSVDGQRTQPATDLRFQPPAADDTRRHSNHFPASSSQALLSLPSGLLTSATLPAASPRLYLSFMTFSSFRF